MTENVQKEGTERSALSVRMNIFEISPCVISYTYDFDYWFYGVIRSGT